MKIEWSKSARYNRRKILDYIYRDSPQAAIGLNDRITQRVERLIVHPHSGRPGRIVGTRELLVHPNYVVVYSIDGDRVHILRVIHAAQRWP